MEQRHNIHLAYESERGIHAICPTTLLPYITSRPRYDTLNGQRVVHCACRHCDSMRRTRIDRDFNPSQPQWHLYLVVAK